MSGKVRTTLYIDPVLYYKLKAIGALTHRKLTEVVNEAYRIYIEKYEAEHGEIPLPEELKRLGGDE